MRIDPIECLIKFNEIPFKSATEQYLHASELNCIALYSKSSKICSVFQYVNLSSHLKICFLYFHIMIFRPWIQSISLLNFCLLTLVKILPWSQRDCRDRTANVAIAPQFVAIATRSCTTRSRRDCRDSRDRGAIDYYRGANRGKIFTREGKGFHDLRFEN